MLSARARSFGTLFFTPSHEWAEVDGSTARVGITNYAAHHLGEIVFADLPEVDSEFAQFESIGAVESVKAASDVMAPFAGKVLEVNSALEDAPTNINESPLGDGWMVRLELEDIGQAADLMTQDAYDEFLKTCDH